MKTILTIQHTQSVHHTNGMVGSWTDWELTDLGLRQADRIGERLRENIEMQEKTVDDRLFSDAESRRDEWDRLSPFFTEIMQSADENIILVSHGDLLSVFFAMFLGQEIEAMNDCELFGLSGGVSYMYVNDDGKRFIKKISDMAYML